MDFPLNDDQKRLKARVIWLFEDTLSPLEERIGETNIASRDCRCAGTRRPSSPPRPERIWHRRNALKANWFHLTPKQEWMDRSP